MSSIYMDKWINEFDILCITGPCDESGASPPHYPQAGPQEHTPPTLYLGSVYRELALMDTHAWTRIERELVVGSLMWGAAATIEAGIARIERGGDGPAARPSPLSRNSYRAANNFFEIGVC